MKETVIGLIILSVIIFVIFICSAIIIDKQIQENGGIGKSIGKFMHEIEQGYNQADTTVINH